MLEHVLRAFIGGDAIVTRENPKIDKVGISSLSQADDIDEFVENYLVVLYRRRRFFFFSSCWLLQRKNMFTQWSMEEIRRKKMTFSVNAQMRLFFLASHTLVGCRKTNEVFG